MTLNSVMDFLDNLDIEAKENVITRLIHSITHPTNKKTNTPNEETDLESKPNEALTDEEREILFNRYCGSWDWPEEEYPTDQFISDLEDVLKDNEDEKLKQLFAEYE